MEMLDKQSEKNANAESSSLICPVEMPFFNKSSVCRWLSIKSLPIIVCFSKTVHSELDRPSPHQTQNR